MSPKKRLKKNGVMTGENDVSADLYRATWENSFDGLRLIDSGGQIVMVNPAFCQMVGKSRIELDGQPLSVIYAAESGQSILNETVKRIQKNEIVSHFERKAILWDGREVWFELSNSIIEPMPGRRMLLSIFRNITRRRQAQQQIRLLAHAIASVSECVSITDLEDRIIYVNLAFEKTYGYKAEEMIGKVISTFVRPAGNQVESIDAILPETIKGGWQGVLMNQRKDGSEFPIFLSTSAIRDENNKVIALMGVARDISERQQAEAALRQSEIRLRSVWDGSFDGMRLTDKDGKIIAVNEAFCRQVGLRKAELEGASMRIIYPAENRASVEKQYRENFIKRRIKSLFESNIQLWNNQEYWFEVSNSFIESTGDQTFLLSIFRNVTKRKKVEADLADSARKFHWLYEFAPIAYHTITAEGTIIDVNRQWCQVMGYNKEEVYGRSIFDFVVANEREAARISFAEKKRSKKYYVNGHERRYLTKAGSVRTFAISDFFIFDENATIHSIQTTMADITERKQAEEALRLSEAKFRNLVESSLDIIWQVDSAGRIVYFSPNIKGLLGHAPDKLIGKLLVEVIPRKAISRQLKIILALIAKHQVIKDQKLTIVNQRGQEVILDVNAVPTYDGGKIPVGYIGTARDVTLQTAAEKEHITVQKLESLCLLAGGIAHDFNNMLVGILGNISLAKMKIDDPNVLRIIEQAEMAALRSRNLTQQLLTFAKGGAPIREIIPVESFLRETVEFALAGSSVSSRFDCAAGLPDIKADRGQLTQVIQNLVINAVQAMPGGGTLTISASASAIGTDKTLPIKPGYYLKIVVQDTGVGIPRKLLTKIFDPYYSTKPHGTGLGLSVVYSIIQKHSGYIFVESRPGIGTTFTIYLPAIPEEKQESCESDTSIPRGAGRILLMDDDELICEVAKGMISYLGYEVHSARNGEAAIQMYRAAMEAGQQFDIVIMDLTIIGGMSGKEAIVELKKINPEVKALVSSGYSTDPIMSVPEKYGFIGVIAKPYRMEEIARLLKKYII